MKARIRKINKDGHIRIETSGDIKDVVINEDFLYPQNEHISLCFKGQDSSGIIDLNIKEINMVIEAVRKRKSLIKGVRVMEFEK